MSGSLADGLSRQQDYRNRTSRHVACDPTGCSGSIERSCASHGSGGRLQWPYREVKSASHRCSPTQATLGMEKLPTAVLVAHLQATDDQSHEPQAWRWDQAKFVPQRSPATMGGHCQDHWEKLPKLTSRAAYVKVSHGESLVPTVRRLTSTIYYPLGKAQCLISSYAYPNQHSSIDKKPTKERKKNLQK